MICPGHSVVCMMDREKDSQIRCSWDGDPVGWPDYVRKVRLTFEKTKANRRQHLGPELVSQLTGRAWVVTQEIDHEKLVSAEGARYLVEFLEEHLARVPVPDAGTRAEDLLVRLRRPSGMSMATWCHTVRETYRKLQRALKRARQHSTTPTSSKVINTTSWTPPSGRSPSSSTSERRKASKFTVPEPEGVVESEEEQTLEEDEAWPGESPADRQRRWKGKGVSKPVKAPSVKSERSEEREARETAWGLKLWSDMDDGLPEVLPTEILGWIMLRRSSLNAAQRLSVLSSIGNSLRAEDVEKGLRGAEDELRLHEREQAGKGFGKKSKMSFWVENNGEWGLLAMDDAEGEDIMDGSEIHWVGSASNLLGIYSVETTQQNQSSEAGETMWFQEPDGGWLLWAVDPTDGEYYTQDTNGVYWAWSDWEASSVFAQFSTDQQKELEEAYAAYEGKMRTFTEARNLVHSKQQSRGFFPRKGYGKSKGKNKGKGKGGSFNFSTSGRSSTSMPPPRPSTPQISMAMATQEVLAVPGSSGFSGCFICGSLTHGFRECPNRGKGRGKHGGAVFMVSEEEDPSPPSNPSSWVTLVANVDHPEEMGFGVIDTGATESVTSLEALEKILNRRSLKFGTKEGFKVIKGPNKTFKFGNGLSQSAESFILLPQTLGDMTVSLGLFTIDASGVPVLIGIRSLEKLGAIIDCTRGALVLKAVDAALLVPLARSKSGHLLLNLCDNWLDGSSKIMFVDNVKEEKIETASTAFGIFEMEYTYGTLYGNVCGHTHDHVCRPHLLPQHAAVALVSPVVGSYPSFSQLLHDLSHQVLHPLHRFHSSFDPVQVLSSIFSSSSSIVFFSDSGEQEVGQIFMVNGEGMRESDSEETAFEQAREVLSEEEFVMYGELESERARNEFLLEKCLVRAHGSSEPHSPQLPATPSDQMNFRALAVLAASSSLHFAAHGIFSSCEGTGQEGRWCKEGSGSPRREIRLVPSYSGGSSRSPDMWCSLPRSSFSGTTRPRVSLGIQRPRHVAGLPGVPFETPLRSSLRSTCNDKEPGATSLRRGSCDSDHSRERDQGQSSNAQGQDHWTGRSREELPDSVAKDSS